MIDNDSTEQSRRALAQLQTEIPNLYIQHNEQNLGLAAALNQGARFAQSLIPSEGFILLLDQDSEPQPGSIDSLLQGFHALSCAGERVGAVGPTLQDADTGLSHGFHQQTRWRWRRVHPAATDTQPVPCTNLNGSGTLMPLNIFLEQGGLDEALFIDHVDTEWSFRLLAAGYTLWGIPQAIFIHRMGQASIRYWLFGWRLWPSRSPARHYYLFRNAIWLMRRDYVSRVWKFWVVIKLLVTMLRELFLNPNRKQQARMMIYGVISGKYNKKITGGGGDKV
ncbi:glycosyltransferase [Halothiobacillus sp. DCM-1]|uniref:glycosyltransferase n=1 Tax=Halothiobacillus sp. DCM-1 TaxID=3112558 RepID=UPI0032567529